MAMLFLQCVYKVGRVCPHCTRCVPALLFLWVICSAPLAPNAALQAPPIAAAMQERSNCLDCQGSLCLFFSFWTSWGCQGVRCFSMALSMVRNFCLHAV